ncbi:DUF4232 domain-containing protein [Streptomyces sp. NPDC094143]|uniref:DUF4232 domain-containing protein n=1 Tax=Streptomyces sp. NPDC094143 TaxID=3155310 RepID=UPI00332F0CF1
MNRRMRTTLAVSAALGAGLLMTACEGDPAGSPTKATDTPSTSASASVAAPSSTAGSDGQGGTQGTEGSEGANKTSSGGGSKAGDDSGAQSGSGSGPASSSDDRAGDKTGYGQGCGTNDLQWSAKAMTQGGGHYQISVKAKPGITCVLPGGLPVIAFGSGGTQASNAEQVAGDEITLSGGKTVYAGVSPKTTNDDHGAEYTTVIVSVSEGDPNPISLNVGSVLVDEPVVTNWHTSPADAVPAV